MNRKIYLTLLVSCIAGILHAQNVGTYHKAADSLRTGDIRERLVQLAMQNPEFEIADRKLNITEYQLNKAKGDWLGAVQGSINLNEITLTPAKGAQIFYPLWNVTIAVPLNFYSEKKNNIKVARENVLIATAEKNDRYRKIRTLVLSKYEDYLMNKEKLEMQSRVTQDAYQAYKQSERDFEDNLITNDNYTKAYALYKEQYDKQLEITRNFRVVTYELEEIIGVPMDEVLRKR